MAISNVLSQSTEGCGSGGGFVSGTSLYKGGAEFPPAMDLDCGCNARGDIGALEEEGEPRLAEIPAVTFVAVAGRER